MRSCTIALVVLMGTGIFGCSESSGPAEAIVPNSGGPQALDEGVACGDSLVLSLHFPNNTEVGTFTVWNDEVYLTVEFDAHDPWLLAETQAVFFGPSEPNVAQKPIARRLGASLHRVPLGGRHQPPVAHYTYWINLEEAGWAANDTLYFTGVASVAKPGAVNPRVKPRTAWVGDHGSRPSVRDRTLMYVIQPCEEGGEEGEVGGSE
jgi:hypothetical protein